MRPLTADTLARVATFRWLGGPARRWLRWAVRRDDRAALDAVWDRWLSPVPDRPIGWPLWRLLEWWRRPSERDDLVVLSTLALHPDRCIEPDLRETAFLRADDWNHPLGVFLRSAIARAAGEGTDFVDALGRFVTERPYGPLERLAVRTGLTPGDPVTRAVFFLVTGQHDAHRALDPDGALLSRGHTAASPAGRNRIRAAIVDGGDLDLLVVLATSRDVDSGGADPDQFEALADRLVRDGDGAALWRSAIGARLSAGHALIARLPATWRPVAERDRALLAAFRAVAADDLTAAARARDARRRGEVHLGTPANNRTGSPRQIFGAAFSRDDEAEPWLTLTSEGSSSRYAIDLRAYSPAGAERWRARHLDDIHDKALGRQARALREPDGLVYGMPAHRVRPYAFTIWISTSGSGTRAHRVHGPCCQPVPVPQGIVFASSAGLGLRLRGPDPPYRQDFRRIASAGAIGLDPRSADAPVLAGEIDTGLIAVHGRSLRLFDADARLLARSDGPTGSITDLGFDGPERLVSLTDSTEVAIWTRRGRRLVRVATTEAPAPASPSTLPRLAVFPSMGKVSVDGTTWLTSDRLEPCEPPMGLVVGPNGRVVASPRGRYAAVVVGGSEVTIHEIRLPRWVELLHTPIATTTRADLDALPADDDVTPSLVGVLRLLRGCLEHRFGADIAVATVDPIGDDVGIALSRSDDEGVAPD